jgi:hypothetical protein
VNGRLRATRAGRDGAGLVGAVHCWCDMCCVRVEACILLLLMSL